jgi:hypothetical protein
VLAWVLLAALTVAPSSARVLLEPYMTPGIGNNAYDLYPGQTLTAIPGVWTTWPDSLHYKWARCQPGDALDHCHIVGSHRAYTLRPADSGSQLVVVEFARKGRTESGGSISAPTAPIQPPTTGPLPPALTLPPDPVMRPTLTGTSYLGDTLTATPGAWSTPSGYTVSYVWLQCWSTCREIAGETGLTHTVVPADKGFRLAFQAAATAPGGTAYQFAVWYDPAGGTPIPTLLARVLALSPTHASIRYLRAHKYRPAFLTPGSGHLDITWTVRRYGKRIKIGEGFVLWQGRLLKLRVPFHFTKQGKALLRRGRPVAITATGIFNRFGARRGEATKVTKTIRLTR